MGLGGSADVVLGGRAGRRFGSGDAVTEGTDEFGLRLIRDNRGIGDETGFEGGGKERFGALWQNGGSGLAGGDEFDQRVPWVRLCQRRTRRGQIGANRLQRMTGQDFEPFEGLPARRFGMEPPPAGMRQRATARAPNHNRRRRRI